MSYRKDFEAASSQSQFAANALLWQWLQSGAHRANLYNELRNSNNAILEFNSRITLEEDSEDRGYDKANEKTVYLLTRKDHIEQAFSNFSSDPYKALAPGYPVVLASDNNDVDRHKLKRKILQQAFDIPGIQKLVIEVIAYSCHHAMVLSKAQDNFDFVKNIAEEASLFFIEGLYGIQFSNHPVLHEAMEAIYDGMAYQMLARHFIAEPAVPVKALMGEAALVKILDTELRAAMNPKFHTEISELLARSRDAVKTALEKILEELSEMVITGLPEKDVGRTIVDEFKKSLKEDRHIAFHAYKFIDHAMNLYSVRVWVDNELRGADLSDDACKEDIRLLVDLLRSHKKEKEAPDDSLIPIKTLIPGVPGKENYAIRETVIGRLAADPSLVAVDDGFLTGSELLNELAGAIAGTVGNFIASASIVVREILKNNKGEPFRNDKPVGVIPPECAMLIMEALRLDPPAPFLPRLAVNGSEAERTFKNDSGDDVVLKQGSNVLIAMGSLTHAATSSTEPEIFNEGRDPKNLKEAYSYVFGQADGEPSSHRCIGDHMALPFVYQLVKNLFTMDDLAFQNDDKSVEKLEKKWGFVCSSLPMSHKSVEETKQQPLNVVMKIKTPTAVHAEYLKKIVYYGAPVVENLLKESNVVHDARFVILNDDTELALITTYDGGYVEYLEYFAEAAGPLFDMIFEHIQDAPPTPVRDNAQAFADHIARFDVPALAGYFYSAYPLAMVSRILRDSKFASLFTDDEISERLKGEADKKEAADKKAIAEAMAMAKEKSNG